MSDKNIVLSNKIVRGRYAFTKEEQKFIYHVISQISNSDKDFLEYEVCISTLSKLDLSKKNHVRFKQFAKSLISKTIELRSEDKRTTLITSWFSSISHTQGAGVIKACFDPKLKPYLIQLKEEFVQAKLPTLLKFKSKYSSRLYLLLKSAFDRQKQYNKNLFIVYDVETLINDFEMPDSYKTRYSSFKNDFLVKSLQEIDEYTQLLINYNVKKTGRKITSIEFCISEKEKTQGQLKKEIEDTKTLSDYIPKNLNSKATSLLLDAELGLKNHDLKNIFDHYKTTDIENICEELWRCWDRPKIISKQGLLRGMIKQLDKKKTENLSFFDEV